jgi:hypothetical protein
MEWIESLKEPVTRYDLLCGLGGVLIYRFGSIAIAVIKSIYNNVKNKQE